MVCFLFLGGILMSDYFKISDIAKLMRTTPDAIRFYEKNNIIKPERCNDNRYRKFTVDDIRRLYDCKLLQNLQFSISDIASMIQNTKINELDDMIEQREQEIKKTIELQQMALNKIKRIKRATEMILKYKNKFLIQERPHLLIYSYASNNKLDVESVNHPYYEAVMNYHNLFDCTVEIPLENAMDLELENKSKFGFSIDIETASKIEIPNKPPVKELLPCRCAYTVIEATTIINYSSLKTVYRWLEKHNFKLNGDILCRVMKTGFHEGKSYRFYEIWCPIE